MRINPAHTLLSTVLVIPREMLPKQIAQSTSLKRRSPKLFMLIANLSLNTRQTHTSLWISLKAIVKMEEEERTSRNSEVVQRLKKPLKRAMQAAPIGSI